MDLNLNSHLGTTYKSASQKARVITETWAGDQLYCFHCSSNSLNLHRANKAVEDLLCPECDFRYQLKAKKGKVAGRVSNSAFGPKIKAIRENRAPNYLFMGYDNRDWVVNQCFIVPGPFVTEPVIEKRKPLRATAQRSGWIGSNINLGAVPDAGKIPIIDDGIAVDPTIVRHRFANARSLARMNPESRGWFSEVLWCLDQLDAEPGTIIEMSDLYQFELDLANRHPLNQHIRPKLRQQMQVACKKKIVERLERGTYRVLDPNFTS